MLKEKNLSAYDLDTHYFKFLEDTITVKPASFLAFSWCKTSLLWLGVCLPIYYVNPVSFQPKKTEGMYVLQLSDVYVFTLSG